MTRGSRAVAALAAVVALLGTVVIAVRASYGAFKGGYSLTANFTRAAYGFGPNSEIDYLGIDVGHVSRVQLLADHRVRAFLKIKSGFAVPQGTRADIHNRSLFGDPYVALVFPSAPASRFLGKGDTIQVTSVDADTGDLIRTGSTLLEHVNGQDLVSVITSLDAASRGEGDRIAQSIHDGAQLAALYADTIHAQLRALDSFTSFQAAITPDAEDLNALAAQGNRALPTLNAAEADFQRVLDSVSAFAAKLATVIAQERPNFDALLAKGDNVVRLLTMREPQIEQVISGAALYFQKLGRSGSPETLGNGSRFAYFKNFVAFNDVVKLICGLVAPPAGGPIPSQLQPIVGALAGTGVACPTAGANQADLARADLINAIADVVATPERPSPASVGDLVNRILGKG